MELVSYCLVMYAINLSQLISFYEGNIVITGHETPIPLGESRNILCKWHGNNATKMEWYLFGLDTISIESKTHTNSLVLSSHPNSTALDGAMFTCRVTVGLQQYEETINLFVESTYHWKLFIVETIITCTSYI